MLSGVEITKEHLKPGEKKAKHLIKVDIGEGEILSGETEKKPAISVSWVLSNPFNKE